MDIKAILAGAAVGFTGAFALDMKAWSKSTPKGEPNLPFDWGLAARRWMAGAISGAALAAGWNVTVSP